MYPDFENEGAPQMCAISQEELAEIQRALGTAVDALHRAGNQKFATELDEINRAQNTVGSVALSEQRKLQTVVVRATNATTFTG